LRARAWRLNLWKVAVHVICWLHYTSYPGLLASGKTESDRQLCCDVRYSFTMVHSDNKPQSDTNLPADQANALGKLMDRLIGLRPGLDDDMRQQLKAELSSAINQCFTNDPERITVMNPVSRPTRMRLGVLLTDAGLDTMYSQESAELSVSDTGKLYLVYRRSQSGDYAIEWTPATTLPPTMMDSLSEPLAEVLLRPEIDEP